MNNSAHSLAQKLRPFAKKHGAFIKCIKEIDEKHKSPFEYCVGIDRASRTVLYTRDLKQATAILHELGHVLFDNPDGFGNSNVHEYEWLGWEFVVASQLGVAQAWRLDNSNYVVGEGNITPEFGELSFEEQNKLLEERINTAYKLYYFNIVPKSINNISDSLKHL